MGADLLTSLLTAFQAVIGLGMHQAGGATASLYRYLATIEMAGLGLWWLYSRDNAIGLVIFRVFALGAFLWLMQDWQVIIGAVQASFMKLGIILGGGRLSLETVHNAGINLINKGQELSLAIQGKVADPTWLQSLGYAIDELGSTHIYAARWVVAWMVQIAFLVAGIHVFAVQLEFVFFSAVAFVTIPFAVWNRTAWVSERTFGAVMSSGLKLCFLYMLASASIPVLKQYLSPVNPSQQDAVQMLGAGFLILCLQWGAHRLASGLLHGMPSFTHTDVLPSARTVVPVVTMGTTAGAGLLVRGAQQARRVATRVYTRYRGNNSNGSTPP